MESKWAIMSYLMIRIWKIGLDNIWRDGFIQFKGSFWGFERSLFSYKNIHKIKGV